MRKLSYLCYAIVFASVLFFLSCQKENQASEIQAAIPKSILSASSREGNPFTDARVRVENGMLVFDDYKAFKEIHEGLKAMNSNSELNRTTLVEMGYNPDTDEDEELAVIPQYPVLKAFAERHGLITEEQREATEFKEYLTSDNNPEEFPDGCSYDPSLKALLNSQREVGIGNFIVKFIDINVTALIYNKNTKVLEQVRNTAVDNLRNGYDLKIIDARSCIKSEEVITGSEESQTRELTGGACEVDFSVKSLNADDFEFENLSKVNLDNCSSESFVWDFGDGTVVKQINAFNVLKHTFTTNKYPYTVKLTVTCGDCKGQTFSVVIDKPNNPCLSSNYEVTAKNISGGNNVEFKITGLTPPQNITVNFGDGTSMTATAQQSSFFTGTHPYPPTTTNLTSPVSVIIEKVGCPNPVVLNIEVTTKCGFLNAKSVNSADKTVNDRLWRVSGAIWNHSNIFSGDESGSSTQVYRFAKNGPLKFPKNAKSVSTTVHGVLMDIKNLICEDHTLPLLRQIKTDDSYVKLQLFEFTSNPISTQPMFEDGVFGSDHKALIPNGANSPVVIETPTLFLFN